MKKHLILSVSAIALLATPVFADEIVREEQPETPTHTVTPRDLGHGLSTRDINDIANVGPTDIGSGPNQQTSNITQSDNDNIAHVNQVFGQEGLSNITQTNDLNYANVTQEEIPTLGSPTFNVHSNDSSIVQGGDGFNDAKVRQIATGSGAGQTNTSTIDQNSVYNAGANPVGDYGAYLGAAVIQSGQNNASDIDQADAGNSAAVKQFGDGNDSFVDQFGWNNVGTVKQVGGWNASDLTQGGDENTASVWQFGDDNVSVATQTGYFGQIDVGQVGDWNSSTIAQSGNRNGIWSEQVGDENKSTINQSGEDNAIDLFSNGYNNTVVVDQAGSWNSATLIQDGVRNTITIGGDAGDGQIGTDGTIELTQVGLDNSATVSLQNGSENLISGFQKTEWNEANFSQDGDWNVAIVKQGNGGTDAHGNVYAQTVANISNVTQTGAGNYAHVVQ